MIDLIKNEHTKWVLSRIENQIVMVIHKNEIGGEKDEENVKQTTKIVKWLLLEHKFIPHNAAVTAFCQVLYKKKNYEKQN